MKLKRTLLLAAMATAVPMGLLSTHAIAQDDIEEIVVTGSYIKRDREQLSTPVEVFDRSEFEAQGSPNIVDIMQNMPAVSGTVNRSDQYANGGVITGFKNVNIRGLGLTRTLVLMNGKRVINAQAATNAGEYAVDIGQFPNIALHSIELLKNGGSTTYGTDAMAGVFNFKTRGTFEGIEVQAQHSIIDGSDGDSTLAGIFGIQRDGFSWVTSVEYEQRTPLHVNSANLEIDVTPSDGSWPWGQSTLGNPGSFLRMDPLTGNQLMVGPWPWWALPGNGADQDPGCGASIGDASSFGVANNRCGYYYTDFVNLIDDQKRIKVFSEAVLEMDNGNEFYGSVLISRLDTLYAGSPTYPPTNAEVAPYGATSPDPVTVPIHNPGFINWLAGLDPARVPYYDGIGALFMGRATAIEGPGVRWDRNHEYHRFVGGLRGNLPYFEDIAFDISATYNTVHQWIDGQDILSERFQLALDGLGGGLCSGDPLDAGDNAAGCYYFNPFWSHEGASPGDPLYNDPSLNEWFTGESSGVTDARLMVIDGVLSGEAPWALPAGNISWAAGGQYRWYRSDYHPTGDNRVDQFVSSSPFHFLGISEDSVTEFRRYGFFLEASAPITETLTIDAGVRFEDYTLDSVVKPKISAFWDATDWLAFRASFEQTFRTPIIPAQATRSLQRPPGYDEYIAIEVPVPTSLSPEQSTNWGIGAITKPAGRLEGLTASIDYYSMKLSDTFATESPTCACADLVFDGASLIKIVTELFNAGDVEITGIDFQADYQFEVPFGLMQIGANGNLTTKYDIFNADGSFAYDALGKYNTYSASPFTVRSVPELKTNVYASLIMGPHFVRVYWRHIDSYDVAEPLRASVVPEIDKMDTFDVHYTFTFNDENTNLSISAINLHDAKPPLAPHEVGYDMYTHSPLGRVIKLAIKHRF